MQDGIRYEINRLKDIRGKLLNEQKSIRANQFRENFVQKVFPESGIDSAFEFVNKELRAVFEVNGIHFTTTSPGTPNQNAFAERVNRTIMESARALMFQAGAPKSLWAEAVSFAVYCRNRLPHKGIDMKIPAVQFPDVSFIDKS